ncbi:MAG: alpha/beta hydrolase [Candidatus Lokiarchaeota archaeon]|nr:alpha/beta hydrolase [Candidatus Lokiarchaeota archaeon]
MTELFADVNGIKICYEIKGEGEPVFLVHGFSDRKEHWRGQFDNLSNYFKVIRFDNRGAGRSDRPEMVYNMELFADDIKGLLDHLKIEKAHVIGHSLGGMIVQNFAIKYPNRANKIILINTIAGMTPPGVSPDQGIEMYRKNAIAGIEAMEKDPLGAFLIGSKASYSREFWKQMNEDPKKKFHNIWSVEDLLDEKMRFGPTEKDINHQAEALKSHNVYEKLPKIKNEVLVIAADKDKSCPKLMNEKIHELLPNSKFIVIEKAAHQSILEYPHKINQHIIDFLKN